MTERSYRMHSYKILEYQSDFKFALLTPATWIDVTIGDGLFCLVGEEGHSWNVRKVKAVCFYNSCKVGKTRKKFGLETVAYDFLF